MAYSTRLPREFPIGTKLVVESRHGRNGQFYSRHLEFPDGTFFQLPARPAPPFAKPRVPMSRRRTARRRRNRNS
jgi:hypothetical protein